MASRGLHPHRHLYNVWWYPWRWQQLDGHPLCAMCLAEGQAVPATVVDHVTPHQGDPWIFRTSELQSLCAWHHDAHKKEDEARGYRGGYGPDGLPLDPSPPALIGGSGLPGLAGPPASRIKGAGGRGEKS